jgi:hypothetical protein
MINEANDQIYQILTELKPEERKKINFHIIQNIGVSELELKKILQHYGNQTQSLNITSPMSDASLSDLEKECEHLEKLTISNPTITSIPFKNLKTLNCSSCPSLKELPELSLLTTLICLHCKNLKELPLLANLISLDCSYSGTENIPAFPQLTTLICKGCKNLKELSPLINLKTLNCSECSLRLLPAFPHLVTLNCKGCKGLKELPLFVNLETLDCSECNLERLPEFKTLISLSCKECLKLKKLPFLINLKTISCSGCVELREIPGLEKLQHLHCSGCSKLKKEHIFIDLLKIYLSDEQQYFNLTKSIVTEKIEIKAPKLSRQQQELARRHLHAGFPPRMKTPVKPSLLIEENQIKKIHDYFNSKEEVQINDGKKISKGELRKTVVTEFPFLIFYLAQDISLNRMCFAAEGLQDAIDNGYLAKELMSKYDLNSKTLKKLPLSRNNRIAPFAVATLLQKGILKSEQLPPNSEEQAAFCDMIAGCITLAINFNFLSSFSSPEKYPEFLNHLIMTTAKHIREKNWTERAQTLPSELTNSNSRANNIGDSTSDFIKTIFLPYYLQKLNDYTQGNAEQEFNTQRHFMTSAFFKNIPLDAILELSAHWHEPAVAAQLNKAKVYSNDAWEPLFSSVKYKEFQMTAVALTTSRALSKEGDDLGHCVGSYTHKCLANNSHIISLRNDKGIPLSTIELEVHKGKGNEKDSKVINVEEKNNYHLRVVQHFGYKNTPPSEQCQTLKPWLSNFLKISAKTT